VRGEVELGVPAVEPSGMIGAGDVDRIQPISPSSSTPPGPTSAPPTIHGTFGIRSEGRLARRGCWLARLGLRSDCQQSSISRPAFRARSSVVDVLKLTREFLVAI
jgi:hypothetical protein